MSNRLVDSLRYSIKAKLVIMMVGIVIGVVGILTFVIAVNSTNLLQRESKRQLSQFLNQSVDILSVFLDVREANLDLWAANPLVNALVSDPALASVFVPSLREYTARIKVKEPWIQNILLVKDDSLIYDDANLFQPPDDLPPGFSALLDLPTIGLHIINLDLSGSGQEMVVLALKRNVVEGGVKVKNAYIIVTFDLDTVNSSLFGKVRVGQNGFVSIIGETNSNGGNDIWIPAQELGGIERSDFLQISREWQTYSDIPERYGSIFLDKRQFDGTPITIVGITSIKDFQRPVINLIYTSIIFGILASILGILGAFFFSSRLTAPIRQLTERTRSFTTRELRRNLSGTNLQERNSAAFIDVKSKDEIGELASAFNQAAVDLSTLINELELRNEISRAIIARNDLNEILATIVQGVAQSGEYDRVRLYLYDEEKNVLLCRTTFGVDEENMADLDIALSGKIESVSEWVFTQKTPYVVEDVANDRMADEEKSVKLFGNMSLTVVPLLAEDKTIGIMAADYDREGKRLPKERLDSLVAFANTAALAIENSILYRDLERRVRERTQQLEEANVRLKELDKTKSNFLSMASHELRTPLTSVLGFTKIISRRFNNTLLPGLDKTDAKVQRDAKRVEENLGIIIDEGERLTRLINDVLDLAKIESGKMEWNMEELSLFELVRISAWTFSSVAGEKGIEINIEKKGEEFSVYGDKDRLTQVVTNLMSNSIKFTPEGGSINCKLESDQESVVVKVSDTGNGIAAEDLHKVFDRFKQVGDTLSDRPKGTGLGLPICREIIEHHGGEIQAESKPGEGSTFFFTLPALGIKAK